VFATVVVLGGGPAAHLVSATWISEFPTSAGNVQTSLEGHKLVHVGADRGIIVLPDGTGAVAQQSIQPNSVDEPPTAELRSAVAAAKKARDGLQAPCPQDADGSACISWCRAVSPTGKSVQGRLQGDRCSTNPSATQKPSCVCEELGAQKVTWAMCVSACPVKSKPTEVTEGKRPPQSPETKTKAPSEKKAATSSSEKVTQPNKNTRYLLYDTLFGSSFAAQLEVLFVAMQIVSELNKKVAADCVSTSTSPPCARWTLALPPWCSVVHWYSNSSRKPWRELFDVNALAKQVPVVEAADLALKSVDLVAILAVGQSNRRLEGEQGRFVGWEQQRDACQTGGQKLPQTSAQGGRRAVVYSGYCDGDMPASDMRCGLLMQNSIRSVVDMMSSVRQRSGVGSVLLKHLDALQIHSKHGSASQQYHPALRPARRLVGLADSFIRKALGGHPFVAVHLRRNDYIQTQPGTTPTPEAAAGKINHIVREHGLDQVFVATDGRPEFCEALRSRVRVALYYFSAEDGAEVLAHKGEEQVAILHVLAKATQFIGSKGSAYSAAVRRERRHLGLSTSSSEEVFCEGLSENDSEKRCTEKTR